MVVIVTLRARSPFNRFSYPTSLPMFRPSAFPAFCHSITVLCYFSASLSCRPHTTPKGESRWNPKKVHVYNDLLSTTLRFRYDLFEEDCLVGPFLTFLLSVAVRTLIGSSTPSHSPSASKLAMRSKKGRRSRYHTPTSTNSRPNVKSPSNGMDFSSLARLVTIPNPPHVAPELSLPAKVMTVLRWDQGCKPPTTFQNRNMHSRSSFRWPAISARVWRS